MTACDASLTTPDSSAASSSGGWVEPAPARASTQPASPGTIMAPPSSLTRPFGFASDGFQRMWREYHDQPSRAPGRGSPDRKDTRGRVFFYGANGSVADRDALVSLEPMPRRWWSRLLPALGLAPVLLAPLLGFRYFSSQDGPTHVENAAILLGHRDPARPALRAFYELSFAPVPNWFACASLAALQSGLGPRLSEKALLVLYVSAIPLAFAYA